MFAVPHFALFTALAGLASILPLATPTVPSPFPAPLVAIVENAGSLRFVRLDGSQVFNSGRILAVSSNPTVSLTQKSPFAPSDDPRSHEQWALRSVGAKSAWSISTGKSVVVAVLDTGVAAHEDLPRLLPGKSFTTGGEADPNGHGTHVAGIIAAAANNQIGVAGLAPDVEILPVQVLEADGSGDHAAIASGIVWATDNGADVINLSLGGTEPSEALHTAVQYAHAKGVLLVAAAGNEGSRSNSPMYPAAYDEVLAVAASGPDGTAASFSNSGTYVDLAAPGFAILSTTPDGYDYLSGTSQAAPFVSAAAALLLDSGLSHKAVTAALLAGTRDVAPTGRDDMTGAGFLDAAKALGAPATGTTPDIPELPAVPNFPPMPTLRPPGNGDTTLPPLVVLSLPARVKHGGQFTATLLVANCPKCQLSIEVPLNKSKTVTITKDSTSASLRFTALTAGTVTVRFSDGSVAASKTYEVDPKILVQTIKTRRGMLMVSGVVRPPSPVAVLELLDDGVWRLVSSVPLRSGSFTFQARRPKPGLYRVVVDGAASRVFPV